MRGRVPAAVVAVAVSMTGCTSSAPAHSGSATPDAGSPAVGGQSGNVHRFGERARVAVDGAAARVAVSKPCATGQSYAVRVTVAGLSGTFDVNPMDFSARDRSGDTFDADLGGVDDQIDPSSLPPGDRLHGRVAFDVPKGKRIAAVDFLTALGEPVATWRAGNSGAGSTPATATSCGRRAASN